MRSRLPTSRPGQPRHSHHFSAAGLMAASLMAASLIAVPTTSCTFVLDFDKFEENVECARCKDVDPCNPSTWCTDNNCFEPNDSQDCEQAPPPDEAAYERCGARAIGDAGNSDGPHLASGHRLAELSADMIGKTQVLVGKDFLYHVAYVKEGDERDVVVRAFALDQLESEPDPGHTLLPAQTVRVSALLEEAELVRSPGSIGLDTTNHVVLYVAHGRDGEKTATLSRVVFQAGLKAPSAPKQVADPPNYRVGSEDGRVGPAAGYLQDGTPFVAWQGCRGKVGRNEDLCGVVESSPGGSVIFTQVGEELLRVEEPEASGIEEPLAVSALQALSDGAYAGVVWGTTTTVSSNPEVTLWLGVPADKHANRLPQCARSQGYALNSIHATPTHNGIASIAWSKRLQDGGSFSTEATSAACGADTCLERLPDRVEQCEQSLYPTRVFENVSAAAHGVWMLDANDSTSDASIISAKVYKPGDAETRLTVTHSVGSPNPNEFAFLESKPNDHLLAEGTPAWPELGLQTRAHQTPGATYSVVGVSWVERATEMGKEVAKLQTFDLCLDR